MREDEWLTCTDPTRMLEIVLGDAIRFSERKARLLAADLKRRWADECSIVRCVIGNPFRPAPHLSDAIRTSTVVSIATAIYDENAWDRLAVLADALEEAGCDNAEVLAHCRGRGPHVRGCWVVDLLLGKS